MLYLREEFSWLCFFTLASEVTVFTHTTLLELKLREVVIDNILILLARKLISTVL